MAKEEKTKIKLKDLKNNPYHNGQYDKEQIKVLETSIRTLGILRSFSVFKKGKDYYLVCGHHTREAAIRVLGKDKEVEITIQPYDDDTAVWGMAVENITQSDKVRQIEDLIAVRSYLKKNFKDYKEFTEFMKKKGVAVGNPDTEELLSKSNKRKDGQEKRDNNYPQIGSARMIADWLNRQGIIMDFHEISELLRIKDNLSPDLYEKMNIGQRSKKDETEDEETTFNLTNAKMLASIGPDHKEQKEILSALENSLGERMHRVRNRAKAVVKYKELKKALETGKLKVRAGKDKKKKPIYKEVELDEKKKNIIKKEIDLIRKGKKDIGNIGLPNIELPQSITEVTIREYTHNLHDKFRILGNEMEKYSKEKLSQNSLKQLEDWLLYLEAWGNHKFADFFKAVVEETAKKRIAEGEKETDNSVFVFKFEKENMKGGDN